MKVLDLFSGIGGFALAGDAEGFETVAFCEVDEDCRKVLAKRYPGKKIYKDVKKLTKEKLDNDGITADVIVGGFPCQPYSIAGEQRGSDDDRDLWGEMFRIIREVRPRWVIGENVKGFISMALDNVSADLESAGYEVRSVVLPATSKNAHHRRDRVWIIGRLVGNTERNGSPSATERRGSEESGRGTSEGTQETFQFT